MPQWFVVGFPRPATVHTLREPQDGLRFPSARTVAPRPYLPSHLSPAREGQSHHKRCLLRIGTTVARCGCGPSGLWECPFCPAPLDSCLRRNDAAGGGRRRDGPWWGCPARLGPGAPPFTLRFPSGRTATHQPRPWIPAFAGMAVGAIGALGLRIRALPLPTRPLQAYA